MYLSTFCIIFFEKKSQLGWLWTAYVAPGDLELLVFLPYFPKSWVDRFISYARLV